MKKKSVSNEAKTHFLNLFKIALADNDIDPLELKFLYEVGQNQGIDKSKIDEIIENPHKIKFEAIKTEVGIFSCLHDVARMVVADGKIDPREIDLFKQICRIFSIKDALASDLIEYLVENAKDYSGNDTPHSELLTKFKQKHSIENLRRSF